MKPETFNYNDYLRLQAEMGKRNEYTNALIAKVDRLESQLVEYQYCSEISTIPCCVCGGEVIEFTIPNDIWNFVMRPDGHETDKEYLCLDCWYKALRNKMFESDKRLRLQQPIKVEENTIALACECSQLKQQLATVTAERDAAVEDTKIIADTYREKVGDDGICGLCKFDADHGLDGYANECPGFYKNDCFEYCGERSGENG